jgi:probable F420-dependent oxidoreductase
MRFTAEITLAGDCSPAAIGGRVIAEAARAAEELGFDAISFNDHPIPSRKWLDAGGHDAHDPFAVLGFCAAATQRLRLIPFAVILPHRNPFVLAKAFASLDVLSEGRTVASVCVGYLRSEFEAVGVPFAERNDRFDEGVEAMRTAWEHPEGTSFVGRFFTARNQVSTPPPVQRPLPIWISGNSRRSVERAGRYAQGWAPLIISADKARTVRAPAIPDLDAFAVRLDELRRVAGAAGRDASTIEVQAGGGPAAAGGDDLAAHTDWVRALADVGVTQHVIDCQIGGRRDGLAELRRFGDQVVSKLA